VTAFRAHTAPLAARAGRGRRVLSTKRRGSSSSLHPRRLVIGLFRRRPHGARCQSPPAQRPRRACETAQDERGVGSGNRRVQRTDRRVHEETVRLCCSSLLVSAADSGSGGRARCSSIFSLLPFIGPIALYAMSLSWYLASLAEWRVQARHLLHSGFS
jgi:hypothetical protein